jgi:hypothetical protein
MAETKEERRARIEKEVAARSAARKEAYFETQTESKAAAAAKAPDLPAPDAYKYDYVWRQDVGAATGQINLVKTINPYYNAATNEITDPATGETKKATQSMWSGPTSFRGDVTTSAASVSDTGVKLDVKDPISGLTPAQIQAKKFAEELAKALGAKIDPATGLIDPKTMTNPQGINTFSGVKANSKVDVIEIRRVKNPDGTTTVFYSDGSTKIIPATVVIGNGNGNGDGSGSTLSGPSTNVDVLKAMLRGLGFNSTIIDASSSFLLALLKDGLDYDNAVEVFLNTKEYTTKDGKKLESPFYAEYAYLNEGLVRPKTAAELYNFVEGAKEVASTFNLNQKFISKDYLKKYVKNNVSAADLSQRANLAKLKAVNADPAYIDSLKRYGYITNASDLTDFFLDPEVGQDTLNQRRASAAFGAEAIKRAKQGITFSTQTFDKIVSVLMGQGYTAEGVEIKAAQGLGNVAEVLMPTTKLSGIYERLPKEDVAQIEQELLTEEFQGLASERRARLKELETRAYQGAAGTTSSSLKNRTAGII